MNYNYKPLQPSQLSCFGQKVLIELRKEWPLQLAPSVLRPPPSAPPGWPRTWNTQIANISTQDLLVNTNRNFVHPLSSRVRGPNYNSNVEIKSKQVVHNEQRVSNENHDYFFSGNDLSRGQERNQYANEGLIQTDMPSQLEDNAQYNMGQTQKSVLLFDENDDREEEHRQVVAGSLVKEPRKFYDMPLNNQSTSAQIDICSESYLNADAGRADNPQQRSNHQFIERSIMETNCDFTFSPIFGKDKERMQIMNWLTNPIAIQKHSENQETQRVFDQNVESRSNNYFGNNRIEFATKQPNQSELSLRHPPAREQNEWPLQFDKTAIDRQRNNYDLFSETKKDETSIHYEPIGQKAVAETPGFLIMPMQNSNLHSYNVLNDSMDSRKSSQDLELGTCENPNENLEKPCQNSNLMTNGINRKLTNSDIQQKGYIFKTPLKRKQVVIPNDDSREKAQTNTHLSIKDFLKPVTNQEKYRKKSAVFLASNNEGHISTSAKINANQRKITDMFATNKNCSTNLPEEDSTNVQNQEQSTTSMPMEKYTVTFLNENRIPEVEQHVSSSNLLEVALTIMYKEGFSQLNQPNNTKSEPCTPAGIMLSLTTQENTMYCYLGVIKPRQWTDTKTPKLFLRNLFELPCAKLCQDSQAMYMFLIDVYGFEPNEVMNYNFQDPAVGCWLLDPDNAPSRFEEIASQLLGQQNCGRVSDRKSRVCKNLNTLTLTMAAMRTRLEQQHLWGLFLNMEMKLVPILAVMELRGIFVDKENLHEIGKILEKRITYLQEAAYVAAGKRFQLNSAKQLCAVLYDDLQLDKKHSIVIKETVGRGAKSTAGPMLMQLKGLHPLPGLVLEHRHLQKLKSTYVDAILLHVREDTIFTTWEQMSAATGRLASSNPNLQAIPKQPVSSTTDLTLKEGGPEFGPLCLRSPYKPREGCTFLAADFKHIEFRLFAHLAQDQRLLQLLQKPGDIFMVLAKIWLSKQGKEPEERDRERTKRIVYAVMYGAGAGKLAEFLHVPPEEATAIINSFVEMFPALRIFPRRVIAQCRLQGYLCSISGRRRLFPKISSPIHNIRSHAERQAINFVIQGSAADVCKAAMLQTETKLGKQQDLQARLLLQIHDELVWEVPNKHVSRVKEIVQHTMEDTSTLCEGMVELSITLPVRVTTGRHWGDMAP